MTPSSTGAESTYEAHPKIESPRARRRRSWAELGDGQDRVDVDLVAMRALVQRSWGESEDSALTNGASFDAPASRRIES